MCHGDHVRLKIIIIIIIIMSHLGGSMQLADVHRPAEIFHFLHDGGRVLDSGVSRRNVADIAVS